MTDNPKNEVIRTAIGSGRGTSSILADLLDGTEMALLEVLLYLHDQKLIDKDDLAERLKSAASTIETTFTGKDQDVRTLSFPSRRLAMALKAAVTEQEEGEPQ